MHQSYLSQVSNSDSALVCLPRDFFSNDSPCILSTVNLEIFVVRIFSYSMAATKINLTKTHAHY